MFDCYVSFHVTHNLSGFFKQCLTFPLDILCGENTGAHISRSDSAGNTGGSLPTAVVEAIATKSRWFKVRKTYIIQQNPPTFKWKSRGIFCMLSYHNLGDPVNIISPLKKGVSGIVETEGE